MIVSGNINCHSRGAAVRVCMKKGIENQNANSMFRGVVTTFISQLRLSFTRSVIAGIKSQL